MPTYKITGKEILTCGDNRIVESESPTFAIGFLRLHDKMCNHDHSNFHAEEVEYQDFRGYANLPWIDEIHPYEILGKRGDSVFLVRPMKASRKPGDMNRRTQDWDITPDTRKLPREVNISEDGTGVVISGVTAVFADAPESIHSYNL